MKAAPAPALTSPHNPSPAPGKTPLWRASVPPSPSRGYCSPTNARAGHREEQEGKERWLNIPGDAERSFLEEQLLLYLVCHRVLVGVALLATHVLVHRGDNLQDVVVRGEGCAQGRKGKDTLALRERSQPTEQFKGEQGTKKGCLLPPYLSDKASHPTFLPFLFRALSGTWVTPETAHHFCRTTTHPGFGLLEPS